MREMLSPSPLLQKATLCNLGVVAGMKLSLLEFSAVTRDTASQEGVEISVIFFVWHVPFPGRTLKKIYSGMC